MTGSNPKQDPGGTNRVPMYGVLLFVALATFWGIRGYGRGVENLGGVQGGDQHQNLVLVLKADNPSLFSKDLIFDRSVDLTKEYIPLYILYLREAYHLSGDLAAGYKILVFPLVLIYLLGAYLVFLRFGQRPWVAVVLATFSSLPTAVVLADEIFGLGPIKLMVARTILTGVFPFLFLAFCAWFDKPGRLVLLFLGIGLLANVHPVSALDIAVVFGVTYLLERRCKPRSWLILAVMGLAALAGAAPIAWNHLQHVAEQSAMSAQFGNELVARIAAERLGYIRYPPRSLAALPMLAAHGLTLGVILFSVVSVFRGLKNQGGPRGLLFRLGAAVSAAYLLFPVVKLLSAVPIVLFLLPDREAGSREERLAGFFSLAIFWLTMVELLVFQYGPGSISRPLLSFVATRGARFSVFAVYLLITLAVQLVDWSKVRGVVRVACVLLLVFAAFWQVRDTFRTYLRTREDVTAADLAAVARWARDGTKPEDLFLFDSATFRVMARRSMAFTTKDGDAAVFHRPDRAATWQERMEMVRAAGDDPQALLAAAIHFGAQYVVVPSGRLCANSPNSRLKYRNGTFAVLVAASP